MKKYVFLLFASLTSWISLNVHISLNSHDKYWPSITMQNIEALADDENPEVRCYGLGSLDCPRSNIKVKYLI